MRACKGPLSLQAQAFDKDEEMKSLKLQLHETLQEAEDARRAP